MSTTVLVLLYAYRTVTVVLRLVDFVRVILVAEYMRTTVRSELGVIVLWGLRKKRGAQPP